MYYLNAEKMVYLFITGAAVFKKQQKQQMKYCWQ